MRAFCLCVVLLAGCTRTRAEPAAVGGFALLELFTSEGCSSCPPADALLAQLVREAAGARQPVYALSFHVDYWNNLGWRDPFSRADAASRQRAYAAALGERSVYTPELVVNGREAFNGSNQARARGSIREALKREPRTRLTLHAQAQGDRVQLQFAVQGTRFPRAVLHVALVQDEARSHVTRGENEGRALHHVMVVREFRSLNYAEIAAGKTTLPLSEAARVGHRFIAYFQDMPSMEILAAASATLAGR